MQPQIRQVPPRAFCFSTTATVLSPAGRRGSRPRSRRCRRQSRRRQMRSTTGSPRVRWRFRDVRGTKDPVGPGMPAGGAAAEPSGCEAGGLGATPCWTQFAVVHFSSLYLSELNRASGSRGALGASCAGHDKRRSRHEPQENHLCEVLFGVRRCTGTKGNRKVKERATLDDPHVRPAKDPPDRRCATSPRGRHRGGPAHGLPDSPRRRG